MRSTSRLALIAVVSVLAVSVFMASPVSAADYADSTYYFGYDRAVGAVGNTQKVGLPGNNLFTVQFYYEIWIAQYVDVLPAHIVHMQVEVDSSGSNGFAVDFVATVFDNGVVVNYVYNPYNAPYITNHDFYIITPFSGIRYIVYYGSVIYGPTLNPLPGTQLHAYMTWWGASVTDVSWKNKDGSTSGNINLKILVAPEIWFDNSHTLSPPPTGGGCPNLLVWDGAGFVDEGVLSIHNLVNADQDVTEYHCLTTTPALNHNICSIQLAEIGKGYNYSHSWIDQVKLCAIDKYGRWQLCPLISAIHSRDGNVKRLLMFDDDMVTQTFKGDYINLKFLVPKLHGIVGFVFMIDGHNRK